ncbi:hydroxyacid dehydrogenase [Rhodoplanes elegans]|uniref:Hydroxyacid dehydrogenase n=1 Tax=Rhodoplanes elegans TaxID=29408 RepID=A0A327KTX2_9BRAD|nr:NAD(P)-dependent oxidoreductase [Rhodoplanes elegans]MBK5962524.1 hydroxyacid dehydrogenase [Rhodoplanes elegans]RAI41103.1 hydroxyacid dehydrogenase [Rhodoplanes elegans]
MSQKPTVLLTNPIHPDGEAILAPHANLILAPDTKADTLRVLARDVDGIIVRALLPDDICDHAPKLKGMVRHGVGLDFIPVEQATRRGVMVANLPGCNTQAVTEYFFAALFRLRRPLGDIEAVLRRDGWNAARPLADATREVAGDTLGVIGVGAIGSRIARIAREGFGMTVIGVNKGPFPEGVTEVSPDELFSRSDVIAVTCALTEETRGLVSRRLIGRMKPDAVLINTSRGPVVETQALVDALTAGAIAGAAVDVYDSQPVPADSPLFSVPRLLMTPHVAAITATSMRAMTLGSVDEMLRILRGERPQNLVNPATYAA